MMIEILITIWDKNIEKMKNYMNLWYFNDEKEIEKYKYIIMLDLKKNDLEKLSKKDKVVIRYMEEIERINEDSDFYEYMSAEEDNRKIENSLRSQWKREGLEEGLQEGLKQGKKETTKEFAHKMEEKGIDKKTIYEITGINLE